MKIRLDPAQITAVGKYPSNLHIQFLRETPEWRAQTCCLCLVTDQEAYWSFNQPHNFEPLHDKTNKMTFAPREDSDQPGHPPSLIRVFAVCMKETWALSYPMNALQRLIKLGRCPGWSDSSLGAQIILLVLSWGGSFHFHGGYWERICVNLYFFLQDVAFWTVCVKLNPAT